MHPDFEKVFENIEAVQTELGIAPGVLVVPGWYVTVSDTYFLQNYGGRVMVLGWRTPNARDVIAAQLAMTVVTG